MYKSRKQNDGTYYILYSQHGGNWEPVKTGIRGCNVNRTINKMYTDDFNKASMQKVINRR